SRAAFQSQPRLRLNRTRGNVHAAGFLRAVRMDRRASSAATVDTYASAIAAGFAAAFATRWHELCFAFLNSLSSVQRGSRCQSAANALIAGRSWPVWLEYLRRLRASVRR